MDIAGRIGDSGRRSIAVLNDFLLGYVREGENEWLARASS
jgi:hypothetical protein